MCGQTVGIKKLPSEENKMISLLSEIKTAKSFIAQMEGRIVEKYNWECRLRDLQNQLEELRK